VAYSTVAMVVFNHTAKASSNSKKMFLETFSLAALQYMASSGLLVGCGLSCGIVQRLTKREAKWTKRQKIGTRLRVALVTQGSVQLLFVF